MKYGISFSFSQLCSQSDFDLLTNEIGFRQTRGICPILTWSLSALLMRFQCAHFLSVYFCASFQLSFARFFVFEPSTSQTKSTGLHGHMANEMYGIFVVMANTIKPSLLTWQFRESSQRTLSRDTFL